MLQDTQAPSHLESLLPLYLTMTSVSKTCTSQSTALCSDMRVFSGASWKRNSVSAEGMDRRQAPCLAAPSSLPVL